MSGPAMLQHTALPCPECTRRLPADTPSNRRIGNRRNKCTTCNNFAANVRRIVARELRERHGDEYAQIRVRVEMDLYALILQDFTEGRDGLDFR